MPTVKVIREMGTSCDADSDFQERPNARRVVFPLFSWCLRMRGSVLHVFLPLGFAAEGIPVVQLKRYLSDG